MVRNEMRKIGFFIVCVGAFLLVLFYVETQDEIAGMRAYAMNQLGPDQQMVTRDAAKKAVWTFAENISEKAIPVLLIPPGIMFVGALLLYLAKPTKIKKKFELKPDGDGLKPAP